MGVNLILIVSVMKMDVNMISTWRLSEMDLQSIFDSLSHEEKCNLYEMLDDYLDKEIGRLSKKWINV